MSLCAVRCFCGREIQSAYTRYRGMQQEGASIKDSLDKSGLPLRAAFVSSLDASSIPTPPPVCCRACLMSTVDLTARHNILQRIVRWADGSNKVTAPAPAPAPTSAAEAPAPAPPLN